MDTFIPSNIAEALGWTILHSLWQATLIGAVLMLILQLMKNSNASQRYLISLSSLFAILLMAGITFFTIYQPATALVASAEVVTWFEMPTFQETEKTWQDYLTIAMSFVTAYSPQISLVWLLGVTFLSIHFLFSLLYVHQLKTYKVKPVSVEWERRLNAIAEKIKINRQIKLVESALVVVPTVVGWLKPVILFPLGMLVSLPTYQIESILAHELAHIRRNDFFINILQSIVEILFFYHPAVWYISKHIENERENCCDDIAITTIGDSLTYIKALTNLANMKTTNLSPALAVTGRKGSLFQRVSRIAQNTNLVKKHTVSPKLTAAMIVIMGLLLLATKTEATTFLDSLVEPFENQKNNLQEKAMNLGDTTKKIKVNIKTVIVRIDSLSKGDSTVSIKTIITQNGKSDTLYNIGKSGNMPFQFEFDGDNLKNNELGSDSLGKIWLHYPNGKNKLLLINDLKSFKEFRYLPTDSIFKHLKNLKQGSDFQILNPQDFISTNNPKDRKFWIHADSIGKALPKGGRTYVYEYNAMQNPLVIVNGEGSTFKIGLNENYPLYVIDGEKLPEGKDASLEILRKLNPNDIASMEVFKGEKAIKKYGEQGKNGVIVIKTKKGKKKKSDTSEKIDITKDEDLPQPQNFSLQMPDPTKKSNVVVHISHQNTKSQGKQMVVVDGKVMIQEESNTVLKKMNPNDIQSMSVLKGEEATSIYGDKSKDGVLLITTKEGSAKTEVIKKPTEAISDGEVEVRIYPNPAQNHVSIGFMFEKETQVWVEVHNTLGQKVATIIDGTYLNKSSMYVWDTAKVPAGTYIITVKRGSKTSQHKVILD